MRAGCALARALRASLLAGFAWAACAGAPPGAAAAGKASPPRLVLEQAGRVDTLTFSPDGRLLVSTAHSYQEFVGGTLTFWDAATGRELLTVRRTGGHVTFSNIGQVRFDQSGGRLAVADGAQVRFLDSKSGRELGTYSPPKDLWYWEPKGLALAWHPEGRVLAVGGYRNIRLYDLKQQKEVRDWAAYSDDLKTDSISLLAFSGDGRLLASSAGGSFGRRTTVRVWEVGSRKMVRELEADAVLLLGNDARGRLLAVVRNGDNALLWDLGSGQSQALDTGGRRVGKATLSPGGRWLAATANAPDPSNRLGNEVLLTWDLESGRLTGSAPWRGFGEGLAVDATGQRLAYSPSGALLAVLDLASGQQVYSVNRQNDVEVDDAVFSRDGAWMAIGLSQRMIALWDIRASRTARLRQMLFWGDSGGLDIQPREFSPDSRLLAASGDHSAILYDVITGKRVWRGEVGGGKVVSVKFSPDGRLLAAADDETTLKIWDLKTGELVIEEASQKVALTTYPIGFSRDGTRFILGSGDTIHLLDPASWQTVKKVRMPEMGGEPNDPKRKDLGNLEGLEISPDGRYLAFTNSGYPRMVMVYSYPELAPVRTLSGYEQPFFTRDGKLLAMNQQGGFEMFDPATGRAAAAPAADLGNLRYSLDGRILADFKGGTLRFRDPNTWAVRATMLALWGREWVLATPDGLFDGTEQGWGRILWRFSDDLFDVAPGDAFFTDYYHPGLLDEVLQGRVPPAPRSISELDRRQPRVTLRRTGSGQINEPWVDLEIGVEEAAADAEHARGSGAYDLRLFRNGVLVHRWRGDVLGGKGAAVIPVRAPLSGEDTVRFEAYAFNADNVRSPSAEVELRWDRELGFFMRTDLQRRGGKVTILTIGINHYAGAVPGLSFAVADAGLVGEELGRRLGGAGKSAPKLTLIRLQDSQATKANILMALERLAAGGPAAGASVPPEMQKVQPAGPGDTVVVFFAGHGWAHKDHFYLLPYDFEARKTAAGKLDAESSLATAISDQELEKVFEPIDASHLVLIMDSCYSGQALEAAEWRRGPLNTTGLAQLGYEKGMYILTASQRHQQALETSRLGHGLLTYALIQEGLVEGRADFDPKDGQVLVGEWFDYAGQEVPALYDQLAAESARGMESADNSTPEVQRPRAYYRPDPATPPLVIERTVAAPSRQNP